MVALGHDFGGVLWTGGLYIASGVVKKTNEECVSVV